MMKIDPIELSSAANEIQELSNDSNWWEKEICFHENFPYYALYATKEGRISVNNFATIICYWSALEDIKENKIEEIYKISLSSSENSAQPNQSLVEMLKVQTAASEGFKETQIKKAICHVLEYGNSFDKTLFVMKFNENFHSMIRLQGEELFELNALGYNIMMFTDMNRNSKDKNSPFSSNLMLPLFALFNALLKEKFDCPSCPNPVIGISSISDIQKNGEIYKRDCALPFPGFSLKKEGPRNCNFLVSFTHHDLYHAYRASCVGVQTKAFIKISKIIRQHASSIQEKIIRKKLYHLAWVIEDMEVASYRFCQNDLSGYFVYDIVDCIYRCDLMRSSDIPYKAIIEEIDRNKEEWAEYGLSKRNDARLGELHGIEIIQFGILESSREKDLEEKVPAPAPSAEPSKLATPSILEVIKNLFYSMLLVG
jgi:hypothetical protein